MFKGQVQYAGYDFQYRPFCFCSPELPGHFEWLERHAPEVLWYYGLLVVPEPVLSASARLGASGIVRTR